LIIAAETGVVIGLLGVILYQARELAGARRELEAAALALPELPASSNQRPLRLRLQQLPPINIHTEIKELDWSSIESADYPTYVANLRRIGCPEETIRDIILADINQLYAARRLALEAPPTDWDFWRHPDEASTAETTSEEALLRETRLASLERERRDLIVRILGPSAIEAEFEQFMAEQLQDRSLQFLSPEKRDALAAAIARWRQAVEEGRLIPDDAARQDRLALAEEALDQQIATLLTPEEREQYQLRASPLAERLRDQLRGFGASREEFEQLFRLERQLQVESESVEANASADPQTADRLQAIGAEFDQKVKELLGPQRYADYQRSLDPDYQTLYSLALDHQVPTAVANQVWDMRRAVEVQTTRVRENPLLDIEQKQLALDAIRRETERAIVDVLGEPLLDAYQREGGGWLTELTLPDNIVESSLAPAPPPAIDEAVDLQQLQQVLAAPVP
jgi:hypothetical protein